MADSRIKDLASRATKTYVESVVFDETGLVDAQRMLLDTILRKSTPQTINTTGGTEILDCSLYDQFIISATGTTTLDLDIQNVTDGDTRTQIIVTRADSINQSITFTGLSGTVDGKIKGQGTIYYEIYSANGNVYAIQKNRQHSGSISLSDLSSSEGTIEALDRWDWDINDNMCHLSAKFTITITAGIAGVDDFTLTIANFDVYPENTNECLTASVIGTDTDQENKILNAYLASKTSAVFKCSEQLPKKTYDIVINGSFRIL